MPCRFASSGTVATSRSASRAILALNVASNFLRDLVISVLHRLRQSRTLHTLTFGPISGVHFSGREDRSEFDEVEEAEENHHERGIQENREEDLQGGKVSDGEHLCRGLIALSAVLAGFHGVRKGLGGLPERPWPVGHFSSSVAVTEQRPDRHHPSCRLQFLRQACDQDRVPTSLSESIVQS